ncbi:MAG: glycosyltransferase family 4 protein [Rickettsiaceae bacterium]|nr:glycosyltransferase family 4 protein [Rickettsiaceae bacterium]
MSYAKKANKKVAVKKVIFFNNSDSQFHNHLLPLAIAAINKGYEVKVITTISKYKQQIEKHNIPIIPLTIKRGSINPFTELILLLKIIWIIQKEQPDILHNFTLKPILYGTIASLLCRTSKVINNFLGMGYLFINSNPIIKIIRFFYTKILQISGKFKDILYIAQNEDDRLLLSNLHVAKLDKIINQCSVGIDPKDFPDLQRKNNKKVIFVLMARMLVDKGVNEFIAAAKVLYRKNLKAEFWLVGEPDKQNKASIDEETLKHHHNQGYVKYLGFQSDIEKIWQKADVAVLPSYREGLSRTLLEAGAYGMAIITSNAPGGRELVTEQKNGILVPIKDAKALAKAMALLANNNDLRAKLAKNIRKYVLANYDAEQIAAKTIALYE